MTHNLGLYSFKLTRTVNNVLVVIHIGGGDQPSATVSNVLVIHKLWMRRLSVFPRVIMTL
jgi:hypothetical protein